MERLKAFAADFSCLLILWLLLWPCFALFDSQIGRAGICAAAVATCGFLHVAYEQQAMVTHRLNGPSSEGILYPVTFSGALLRFVAVALIVAGKGFFDLRFTGHLELTIANIQSALNKGGEFGMLATLVFALVAGTAYGALTLRLGLRRLWGVDSPASR